MYIIREMKIEEESGKEARNFNTRIHKNDEIRAERHCNEYGIRTQPQNNKMVKFLEQYMD